MEIGGLASYETVTVTRPFHSHRGSVRLPNNLTSQSKENFVMRHYRLVLICFLAAIGLNQCVVFGQSQANTGTIEGIVNDPSGRAVAGAQVNVTNHGAHLTRHFTSDAEGRFPGLLLPPGPYKITGDAPHFRTPNSQQLDR